MTDPEASIKKGKVWTDAERLELAEKLDKELDDYINSLAKKPKSNNDWSDEEWKENMDKHPFFMKEMPNDPTELSPLVEGLQKLKYDEEYNTPNELAQSYKEDGNFNYKHKKYRLAILSFSKGISANCDDTELVAQLYNNRALAHFKLQNYRSSLQDCKKSLESKPDYLKPLHTATKCYFHLKKYDECIRNCDEMLNIATETNEVNSEIVNLRAQAVKNKKIMLRDIRLEEVKKNKSDKNKSNIIESIKSRNIKLNDYDIFYENQCHVYLNDSNELIWPVTFAYPENGQTDFVENFNESTTFNEQLIEMFKEPPAWDKDKRYQVGKISVYIEGSDNQKHKVQTDQSLKQILQHEKLVITNGNPWFFILVADSTDENYYLNSYRQ